MSNSPLIRRQGSLPFQLITTKTGTPKTRTQRTYVSCRMTLAQRIMCVFLDIHGHITQEIRNALDKMIEKLLKYDDIHNFISNNQSSPFFDKDQYDAEQTISQIRITASHSSRRRYSHSWRSSRRRPSKLLFPMIFFRENGTIPHYFILYYENAHWYIYSSYGSDFVCIGTQKIPVTLDSVKSFILAMNTPLLERTEHHKTIIRKFMNKYFLANGTQPWARCENDSGNTVTLKCDIKKGVKMETDEYLKQYIRVAHVPLFKSRVGKLMKEIYEDDSEDSYAGITLSTNAYPRLTLLRQSKRSSFL